MNIVEPRLSAGEILLQRYQILGEIGQGGMQQVYRAKDLSLTREIALKVPINTSAQRRFERSARLSANIVHPNIAKTLDYSTTDTLEFLIEELIPGSDLQKRLDSDYGKLDCHLVAHVIHHVAKAVAAMNSIGVIHRDLKPSNIMVSADPGMLNVKVTDFGIATMIDAEINEAILGGMSSMAASKTVVGALAFMAPEIIRRGDGSDRSKCDVWSIGALLHFLLFGEYPFGDELAAIQNILNGTIPDKSREVSQANIQFRSLYFSLLEISKSCLKMDPSERPTAKQLCDSLSVVAYSGEPRSLGRICYINPGPGNWGFIRPEDGNSDVFFHFDSIIGGAPKVDLRVSYASFDGDPKYRAFPVAPYGVDQAGT